MARSYHGAASSIRSENYATTLLWTSIPVILPWALTRNKASLPRQIFCARWLHILSVKALPRRVSWRITTLRSSAAFSTVRVTSKSALKLGPSMCGPIRPGAIGKAKSNNSRFTSPLRWAASREVFSSFSVQYA